MENQLKDNSCMLQRILNVLDVREDVVNPLIEDPVNNIDELTELNQKLEDKDYAKQMVVISVKTHLFRHVVLCCGLF